MSKIDEIMEAFEIPRDESEPQLDDEEIESNAQELNDDGLQAEVKTVEVENNNEDNDNLVD